MPATVSRRSVLAAPLAAARRQPNFIFVLVDDLRFDELACTGHPFASTPHSDRLAREGALFTNAFSIAPLCSPSRAAFLTGQYPHTNGIIDNINRSRQSHRLITWPRLLRDAGYETAFIGKWHMGNDDSPRLGFDTWVSFRGQGECINPELNVNGKREASVGYITDILTDRAVAFLQQRRAVPFCLYLAHKAIHPNLQQRDDGSVTANLSGAEAFIPADRHRNVYAGHTLPRRPTYGKPPTGKPALERSIGGLPPLGPETVTPDSVILNRMRMMKAVDEGLGRILAALENTRVLNDTVVVLTSDHGYFYGEHGLAAERRLGYEECIRIPLLIRCPARIRAGARVSPLALNTDIAPTMLALANVRSQGQTHGRPLLPLFDGRTVDWRDDFLIEYYSDTVFPRIANMGYHAVRSRKWKYIRYNHLPGMDELYDLERDPFETTNLAGDASAHRLLAHARLRLKQLLATTGA